MISIPLTNGGETVIDEADLDVVAAAGPWSRMDTKGPSYARHGRSLLLHRLVLALPRGLEVDHINGNGLDNRRENLRPATHKQNLANSGPRGGASRHKGVTWCKRKGRWQAQAMVDGKRRFLGYHSTEDAAALAYNDFARRAWGEFAYQNQLLGGVV